MEYDEDAVERTRGLLRATGDGAFRHLLENQVGDETAFMRPPFWITWCPPRGAVVACATSDQAQLSASNFAGAHPGAVIAVYQLVGYCHVPVKPAPFLPAAELAEIEEPQSADKPDEA